jgi:hypothetical protein
VVLALCSGVVVAGAFFVDVAAGRTIVGLGTEGSLRGGAAYFGRALAAGRTIVDWGTEGSLRGGAAFLGCAFFRGRRGARGSVEGSFGLFGGLVFYRVAIAMAFGVFWIAPPGALGAH